MSFTQRQQNTNLETNLEEEKVSDLSEKELASIFYHDIFDYPLTSFELIHWSAGKRVQINKRNNPTSINKNGYFHLKGREGLVLKRIVRERTSAKKIKMAKGVAKKLSYIPTIKAITVTGALAMGNADEDSDIDLMVITKRGALWTTRAISLLLLSILKIPVRRYGDKNQKDKLCLNIWLDERALTWRKKDRNIFTAHEIAQTVPLVEKDGVYERFILENSWTKNYWPNATRINGKEKKLKKKKESINLLASFIEAVARKLQLRYMRKKITRETVTKTRALFHPIDWTKLVLARFE